MGLKDKILVALDVKTLTEALGLVEELVPHIGGFKVGLELLMSQGTPQVVEAIQSAGGRVFLDGKFKDIPNTVAGASKAVSKMGVGMFNVHCLGGLDMMKAARAASEEGADEAKVERPRVLGVTVLTSFDTDGLRKIGWQGIRDDSDIESLVVHLARLAKEAGLDGVVASPKEISAIRGACGEEFLIVTPGVRPLWAAKGDQKRVTTPKDAVRSGASYLVIGRPITKPPEGVGSPAAAAKKILEEIGGQCCG